MTYEKQQQLIFLILKEETLSLVIFIVLWPTLITNSNIPKICRILIYRCIQLHKCAHILVRKWAKKKKKSIIMHYLNQDKQNMVIQGHKYMVVFLLLISCQEFKV